VCGSCRNRDEFRPYFTKVFNLKIDDNTMRRRLAERTNNEFGKKSEEVELMLRLNLEMIDRQTLSMLTPHGP
jgi:hypothetical protein